RSERSVRRWEEHEGLPVHRLAHEKRGSVYAYPAELDAWWESRRQPIDATPAETQSSPERMRWLVVAGVALATVAALAGWRLWSHAPAAQVHSIAVLPLRNLSSDPQQEYFSDGATEELISALGQIHAFEKVISRTSVTRYKQTSKSMREI